MTCMSYSASSGASHSSKVVCAWQQTCTSLSPVETFGALQTQRLPVSSANSFVVQHLFSTTHSSNRDKDMSMWMDMQCPLHYSTYKCLYPPWICSVWYSKVTQCFKNLYMAHQFCRTKLLFSCAAGIAQLSRQGSQCSMSTHKMCVQSSW
jgi:hypothetical protein